MAWSLIAHTEAGPGLNGGSTSAIDTTGASLLVVLVSRFALGTFSDSKGNTWSQLGPFAQGNARLSLFYCETPTVGSGHTFTYGTTNTAPSILVEAWSGSKASPSFDQSNNGLGGTTSQATGSITPTVDGALLIAGLGFDGTITSITIDNSFATPDVKAFTNSVNEGGAISAKVQATAAGINPTWSWSGTRASTALIASFKPLVTASVKRLSALGVG